jgi:hypothetical protein
MARNDRAEFTLYVAEEDVRRQGSCQPFPVFSNRKLSLRLESGRICVIDELVFYLPEKKHILIDTRKCDRQIVLPIPSSSAGPA